MASSKPDAGKRWRIELLGGLRAMLGDRLITRFRSQKNAALLAYLALYCEHPQPREALIELLWPEIDPEVGRTNFRSALYSLRRELEPLPEPVSHRVASSPALPETVLIADRQTIRLNPNAFSTDVAELREAVQTAARTEDPAQRARFLAPAVTLYKGELLPGFFEPWVLVERQQVAETYLAALHQLAAAREQTGDLEGALEAARQAVSADPLREEAHYDLMRLYAAAGLPSATVKQYQELERLLREELGETPSAVTRALAEELRQSARTVVVARSSVALNPVPDVRTPGSATPDGGTEPSDQAHPERGPSGQHDVTPSPQLLLTPSAAPRLPLQFTRFFGRQDEIARLTEILRIPETRLVTLTGPGGSGKSRLAIAVAGRLQEEFRDAVWFVPLAEVKEAPRLGDALRDALGLQPAPGIEPMDQAITALRDRPALLVMDNFEQLVEEGALWVHGLLAQLPTLTCLVTSRLRLEIGVEQEFIVLPLPAPAVARRPSAFGPEEAIFTDNRPPMIESLLHYPSVGLFVDRAQAARPGFRLTNDNAGAVVALCDRLEGLPLAIELAAARVAVLTPQQILPRLAQRFELLVSHQRSQSSRHRSLRAAIDWSYQQLSPELQRFFSRLSVFRGGFTLEAVETVCQAPRAVDYLEKLRKSTLITADEAPYGAQMRYRLLETLREYAAEQLTPEQQAALSRQHARYYRQLGEQAAIDWEATEQESWIGWLEQEHDNMRAVLDWSLEAVGRQLSAVGQDEPTVTDDRQPTADSPAQIGLALGGALGWFWQVRGYLAEGRERLAALLEGAGPVTPARVRAQAYAGRLASLQGDRETADRLLQESLTLARRLDDQPMLAQSLCDLANLQQGNAARALLEEALAIYRARGDRRNSANVLVSLGLTYKHTEPGRERTLYEEGLALHRLNDDRRGSAWALVHLGNLASYLGDFPTARGHAEECLALFRDLVDRMGVGCALNQLGGIAMAQDRPDEAFSLHAESLEIARGLGSKPDIVAALNRLGDVALSQGETGRAARHFEESVAMARAAGLPWGVIKALLGLGRVEEARGRGEQAALRYVEGLSLARASGDKVRGVWCLEAMVRILTGCAVEREDGPHGATPLPVGPEIPTLERAARLLGAAEALREAIRFPRQPSERPEHAAQVAALRQGLGEPAFTRARDAGRALAWEEAAALVLGER